MNLFNNRGGPPVVPGPDGAVQLIAKTEAQCVACLNVSSATHIDWLGDMSARLCNDANACTNRYRDGVSPESYAAALRGELLAVAP